MSSSKVTNALAVPCERERLVVVTLFISNRKRFSRQRGTSLISSTEELPPIMVRDRSTRARARVSSISDGCNIVLTLHCWLVVEECKKRLTAAGFVELKEKESWLFSPGGKVRAIPLFLAAST